ncbi:MAG: tetratricopeptide repeat protein [Planctomycetota bacterium]|jgi:tetratricopeptide (TPR) repeat protein
MSEWTPQITRLEGGERDILAFTKSLINEGHYDEAFEELHKFLDENPKSFAATLAMGRVHQKMGDLDQAASYYDQAVKLDPKQPTAHLRAGGTHLRLQNVDRAKASFESVLALEPKSSHAQLGLAQVYVTQGNMEQAQACVQEALRIDPQLLEARAMQARILSKSGDPEAAISELETVISMNPEYRRAPLPLARLYLKQKDPDKAVTVLESAARQTPDKKTIWSLLGRVKLQQQNYSGAEDAYREIIRLQPKSPAGRLRLIEALLPQGKVDEARQVLESIPRRKRIVPIIHKYYGDIYLKKGMHQQAAEAYRAAILNSPGGEEIVAALEKETGVEAKGDWQVMIKHYESVIAKLMEQSRKERRAAKK